MKLFANFRRYCQPTAKIIEYELQTSPKLFIKTLSMTVESASEKGIDNIFDNKDISKSLDKLKLNISDGTQLNLFKGIFNVENDQNNKEKASGIMNMIGGILSINVPMFGKVGELFETKRPADVIRDKKNKKTGKFLNSILKIFGIKDGIEGVHKDYIEEQLKQVDKGFTKEAFTYFSANAKAEIQEENTLRKKYNLDETIKPLNLKPEEITKLKDKVPTDYVTIKETLIKTLPNNINKLNINAVSMIGEEYLQIIDGKPVINGTKILENPEEFADKYLSIIVPKFVTSGDDFINSAHVTKETFALGIFGNLVGEKFFVEGINIGSIMASDYKILTQEQLNANQEQIKKNIQSELNTIKNCPLTADMIITASLTNKVPVEYIMAIMKNDSSYGTAGVGAKTHNPGNVSNTDNGSTKDRGTREAGVNAVGENLARRIKEYQTIYGSKMPSLKELANNQGPDNKGFLSSQVNYKKNNPDRKGAYMTDKNGGINVENISKQLIQNNITNQYTLTA